MDLISFYLKSNNPDQEKALEYIKLAGKVIQDINPQSFNITKTRTTATRKILSISKKRKKDDEDNDNLIDEIKEGI